MHHLAALARNQVEHAIARRKTGDAATGHVTGARDAGAGAGAVDGSGLTDTL
jgi:hypothetical protein